MTSFSTYTWNDPQRRVLKLDYFNGVETITSYVPAVAGTTAYTAYLAWTADGNTAKPYLPANQGYGTLAEAKATRIAGVKDEVIAYIHDNFEYEILKGQLVLGSHLDSETSEKIRRLFVLSEALITVINAGNSIDSIRSSSIDFTNLTHTAVS
jgi:hypothetical protein